MKPKRFLIFRGPRYYPGGGWFDFHSSEENAEVALNSAKDLVESPKFDSKFDWVHVVDMDSGDIIFKKGQNIP